MKKSRKSTKLPEVFSSNNPSLNSQQRIDNPREYGNHRNLSNNPPQVPEKLQRILMFLLCTTLTGLGFSFPNLSQENCPIPEERQYILNETQPVSRVHYERLDLNMRVAEVESILGAGMEISRTKTTRVFVWKNPDSRTEIKVIFKEGKLEEKSYQLKAGQKKCRG